MRPIDVRAVLLLLAVGLAVPAAVVPPATACPFCAGGPDGRNDVNAGIFNEDFWPRVAATLAPFPVFGGIVALIHFGPPGSIRRRRESGTPAGAFSGRTDDSAAL